MADSGPHEYCTVHDQPLDWCREPDWCREFTAKLDQEFTNDGLFRQLADEARVYRSQADG